MNQPDSQPPPGDLLVVDDDLPSLRALSSLLVEHGYQVRSARDGNSALMMTEVEPPDLVLLDIQMPGMDGFAVCRALQSQPATRNIPVLFISAGNDVLEKVKSFEIGGVDYITKPLREEELLARIKTHLTIARLNAQLRESNRHLQQEIHNREELTGHLQRRLEEFSALHRITTTISASDNLPQALEAISVTLCELFHARLALIAVLGEDQQTAQALVGHDIQRGLIAFSAASIPLSRWPAAQETIGRGQASLLTEQQFAGLAEPIRAYIKAGNIHSGLVIPLNARQKNWGLLLIGSDQNENTFSQFDLDLAATIAADLATAIENERLAAQAQQAAVNAERQRLARELHDSVSQSIYSLILLGSGWESMARQGTLEDPADSFRRLSQVGQQALRDMRLLIHQLRPSILAEQGLVRALEQRLQNVEMRANIDARLVVEGDLQDLPPRVEDELYHIAQEALNNSLRHARAGQVQVCITTGPGGIHLLVEDDGCGFDPQAKSTGMGLGNMQHRAQNLAGELEIRSAPGHGTQVSLRVPRQKEGEG